MNEKRKVVFDALDGLSIDYEVTEHPVVMTMEEMKALGLINIDKVAKNLFLCDDKRKRFFLVSLAMHKTADLRELQEKLGSRKLSFASEERLGLILGLEKGAVTPFGVLNDHDHITEVVFDKDIGTFDRVGVHPNDNTATVWLAPSDLETVIRTHGNLFTYLEL